MKHARPELSGREIRAFRLRTGHLDQQLEPTASSLRAAAWAGCQDSVPRAAVLSLYARVGGVAADILGDPALAQIWGPGFSAYVVSAQDVGIFTLGRLPERGSRRDAAFEIAALLDPILDDEPRAYSDIGKQLGVNPNRLRFAALTGTVRLHWTGSGKPKISRSSPPEISAPDARAELVRRFLHSCGPATSQDFARWAGVSSRHAHHEFEVIATELLEVDTPIGPAYLLAADAPIAWPESRRESPTRPAVVKLLPSGDAYYLLHGRQRELLVADADHRSQLWTSRVWPGAVLVDGTVVGTWRRSAADLTITLWRSLAESERALIETEARLLPLREQPVNVRWN